ncbi:MAG: hypothetical protein ACT6SC_17860, partial [Blastomonas fulva]
SGPVDDAAAPSRMQRSDDYARAVFDALMARLAAAGTPDRHEARAALDAALDRAIARKPERHDFHIDAPGAAPALARHMSMTGG